MKAALMNPQPLPIPLIPATELNFYQEAVEALPICIQHCDCPDHWHTLWAGLKAIGLLRGVHTQATLFQEALRPHWVVGGRVLIAGAADSGSLDVLHSLYRDGTARYPVVDQCEAPLKLIARRAETQNLRVEGHLADLAAMAVPENWDLVFIHYTLSFMDAAARARVFRKLKAHLTHRGVILVALRYLNGPAATSPNAGTTKWIESTTQLLRQTFADRPQLLAPLLEWLPTYSRSRMERERVMPHADIVRQELEFAGFQILRTYDGGAPGSPAKPDLPKPGAIVSTIMVVGHAGPD